MQELEKTYQSKYITNLSSNIAQVMDSEEKTLKLLPKAKTDSSGKIVSYNGKSITYEQIKKDTAQYYQYSQFKRLIKMQQNIVSKQEELSQWNLPVQIN